MSERAPHVTSVLYVPFHTAEDAYDHALRYTRLSDNTYYVDAIGGDEYQELCAGYPDSDGLIHDRTTPEGAA